MKAELLDSMGSDLAVVNAARVSFDKEHKEFEDNDRGLIRYLARHGHFTPFTHVVVKLRETVPIFVARQRFKHCIGFTYAEGDDDGLDFSYNETSRRYVSDLPEFFTPNEWRGRPVNAKQGSSDIIIRHLDDNRPIAENYRAYINYCALMYEEMIEAGVAPEQARMVLPQSMYTSYIVTGSLAAWARAYKLRSAEHAQQEIQELARSWADLIRPIAPVSWDALCGDAG